MNRWMDGWMDGQALELKSSLRALVKSWPIKASAEGGPWSDQWLMKAKGGVWAGRNPLSRLRKLFSLHERGNKMKMVSSLSSASNRSSRVQGQTGSARVTSRECRSQVKLMGRATEKKVTDMTPESRDCHNTSGVFSRSQREKRFSVKLTGTCRVSPTKTFPLTGTVWRFKLTSYLAKSVSKKTHFGESPHSLRTAERNSQKHLKYSHTDGKIPCPKNGKTLDERSCFESHTKHRV